MTEPAADNGKASTEWVTPVLAAQMSGIRLRELERSANRGEVRRKREGGAKDGAWLYFVADAIALSQAPKNARAVPLETPEAQLAKAHADLLTKTMLHLERSWALLHGPLLDVITELRGTLKESNAEVRALQQEAREAEKQRRELQNDAYERSMAREILTRDQARKDEALEGAKKAAKALWPSVEDAIKGLGAVGKLRATFDPKKIEALLEVEGMLDAREAALLRELFGLKVPGDTVEAEGEPAPAEPTESES